jgi:hypothetical protein
VRKTKKLATDWLDGERDDVIFATAKEAITQKRKNEKSPILLEKNVVGVKHPPK